MDLSPAGQCKGKAKHASRIGANVEKMMFVQQRGAHPRRVSVYRCDHCRFWHIGHNSPGRRR